jgi:hypothetical protein
LNTEKARLEWKEVEKKDVEKKQSKEEGMERKMWKKTK